MTEDQLLDFENEDVQYVYNLLCSNESPPQSSEHWEGWVARKITTYFYLTRNDK